MSTYIRNNLAVKAYQLEEPCEIINEFGTFNGQVGDYVVEEDGVRKWYPKLAFEREFSKVNQEDIDRILKRTAMKLGYLTMGSINLEIANEDFHLENEVHKLIEKNL